MGLTSPETDYAIDKESSLKPWLVPLAKEHYQRFWQRKDLLCLVTKPFLQNSISIPNDMLFKSASANICFSARACSLSFIIIRSAYLIKLCPSKAPSQICLEVIYMLRWEIVRYHRTATPGPHLQPSTHPPTPRGFPMPISPRKTKI